MNQIGLDVEAAVERDVSLSQWFTPPALAEHVVAFCGDLRGKSVIEPAAGDGALVRPLRRAGASVLSCDIDPRFDVDHAEDFFSLDPPAHKFDFCVMNPPYEAGLDCAFLERSLDWAHRTVAILRTHALHGVTRHQRVWSRVRVETVAFLVRRPRFGGAVSGSPKHEFCVVKFGPGNGDGPRRVEWWFL